MKKGYTHIAVVLDRSGSMNSVRKDTIGGFNSFLAEQKSAPGEATLTLVQFDDQFETVFHEETLAKVPGLTEATFVPRGMTALLDAIGRTITLTGSDLAAKPEDQRPEKVIVVILTDGGENSSNEYNSDQIKSLIRQQEEQYAWTFVFIGANQDSFNVSQSMGFTAANTINYVASAEGTTNVFRSMSKGLTKARSMDFTTYNTSLRSEGLFDAEDYKAQEDLGVDNSKRGVIVKSTTAS